MLALVVLIGLSVAYRYGPAQAPARRRWVTTGSLAATALWLAGSGLFSWFASTLAKPERIDGGLGVIITILTWFLLSAYIVILGAELDAEIARERRDPEAPEPARRAPEPSSSATVTGGRAPPARPPPSGRAASS